MGIDEGRLQDAPELKSRNRLTLRDVLQEPNNEEGVRRYNLFAAVLRDVVSKNGLNNRLLGTAGESRVWRLKSERGENMECLIFVLLNPCESAELVRLSSSRRN